MAYRYSVQLTVRFARVPGSQSNVAVLVSLTGASFMKSVASGGHINNSVTQSGGAPVTMPADLIFASTVSGTTLYPWEIESWDGSAGTLVAWVLLPSISAIVDTSFFMLYGDPAVVAQQNVGALSPASVWTPNWKAVYHLGNGTALSAVDSTVNACNANSATAGAGAGKVDGGMTLNGSQGSYIGNPAVLHTGFAAWTWSLWFKTADATNVQYAIASYDGSANILSLGVNYPTLAKAGYRDLSQSQGNNLAGVTTVTDGNWHYAVAVRDTSATLMRLYVDGVQEATIAPNAPNQTVNDWTIGKYTLNGGGGFFTGTIDEVRFYSGVRLAGAIQTEYNNQNWPGNYDNADPNRFITYGAEVSTGVAIPVFMHSYRQRRVA